jgi:hypothetical protein
VVISRALNFETGMFRFTGHGHRMGELLNTEYELNPFCCLGVSEGHIHPYIQPGARKTVDQKPLLPNQGV